MEAIEWKGNRDRGFLKAKIIPMGRKNRNPMIRSLSALNQLLAGLQILVSTSSCTTLAALQGHHPELQ